MKKVKVMLMSIALAAVVGGIFAFKASRIYYNLNLCTTAPMNGTCGLVGGNRTTCENFEPNVRFTNNIDAIFICTTTANAGGQIADKCKVSPGGVFKTCTTAATTKIEAEPSF